MGVRDAIRLHRFLLLGILVGLIFGFLDSLVDVYLFGEGTILTHLLTSPLQETYMRLTVGLSIVVLGAVADRTIRREKSLLGELDSAKNLLEQRVRERTLELEITQGKYRDLFENANDAIFLVDKDLNYIDANKKATELFGYTREEYLKMSIMDVIPEDQKPDSLKEFKRLREKGKYERFQGRIRTKSGEWRDVEVSSSAILDGGHYVGSRDIIRDITERKRAEEKLAYSKKFLKSIIDNEPECVKLLDSEGTLLDMNPAGLAMIDAASLEQVKGQSVYPLVTEEYRDAFRDLTERVCKGESGMLLFKAVGLKGRSIWLETHAVPFEDTKEKRTLLLAVTRDVTERKKTEEELKEATARLETLVGSISDLVAFKDTQGRHLVVNKALEKFMGMSKEELLGKEAEDIFPPEVAEQCRRSDEEAMRSPVPLRSEEKVGEGDGLVILDTIKSPIADENGNVIGMAMVSRDITERKKAEDIIKESEEKFRTLFDSASDAIFLADVETGLIIDANGQAEKLLGRARDEIVGLPQSNIHPKEDSEKYRENFQNAVKEGIVRSPPGENLFVANAAGDRIPVEISSNVTTLKGKKVRIGIFRDITDRKRAEEAIKESEEKFRTLFEASTDGIFILDLKGNFIDINHTAYERLGYTKEEMLAMHLSQLDAPDFADKVPERITQLKEEGHAIFESAHLRKDGSVMPVEVNSRVLEFLGQKVYFSVIRDITDRKKVEKRLMKNQKRLARAQKIAGVGDWEWEVATGKVTWSDELYNIYGVDPETFTPDFDKVQAVMHPDDLQPFLDGLDKVLKGEAPFDMDYRFFTPEGEERTLHTIGEVTYDEKGEPVGMVGIVQDVTERKKAEDELIESEQRFRAIFDNATDGIVLLDWDTGRFFTANGRFLDMLGISLGELESMKPEDIYPGDHLSKIPEIIGEYVDGEISLSGEVPITRKDGIIFYTEISTSVMSLVGKEYLVQFIRDITERKQAEDAIRESREFLQTIIDGVAEPIMVIGTDYKVRLLNDAARTTTRGHIGAPCHEISHQNLKPCYGDEHPCPLEDVRTTGGPVVEVHEHRDNLGNKRYIEILASPMFTSKGAFDGIIETQRDITDRKRAEAELRDYAQRLEEANRLKDLFTDIMRHDVMNPLQVINMFTSQLREEDLTEEGLNNIQVVEESAEKAINLMENAATFAKLETTSELEFESLDLGDLVQYATDTFLPFLEVKGAKIEVKFKGKYPFKGSLMLSEVFSNLISNAIKHSPENTDIEAGIQEDEGSYTVYIKDWGEGIPDKFKEQIFERFKRKARGGVKGSGLGLAIARRIVELHGGEIWVEDNPEGGAVFKVRLPKEG